MLQVLPLILQPRYEILSSGRQLRVKQAQVSDTATFQCLAENKAGTDSVDFNLRVLGKYSKYLFVKGHWPKTTYFNNINIYIYMFKV